MTELFPKTNFIGFDHIENQLARILNHAKETYPPHNIIKTSDSTYAVELAVAGFTINDIVIELQDNVLTVSGERKPRHEEAAYVYKGISARKFKRSFRLSEYTEVVRAELREGILSISLEVKLPKENSPRRISIG